MIEFGEQLRRAREEKGITQQTLAEKLYVTRQSVSHWECGDRFPDLLTTKKISELLDVSLDDLLSGNDMKSIVEKSSIVESRAVNNVIISLYTFVVLSLLIRLLRFVLSVDWKYTIEWAAKCNRPHELFDVILMIVVFVVGIIIFTYGLAHAVKENLTPKKVGVIMLVYLAPQIIPAFSRFVGIMSPSTVVDEWTTLSTVIYALLFPGAILGAIAAFMYFIKNNTRKVWSIILIAVSVLFLFDALIWVLQSVSNVFMYFSEASQTHDALSHDGKELIESAFLNILPQLSIFTLFIYQVITLNRKRKIATELSK